MPAQDEMIALLPVMQDAHKKTPPGEIPNATYHIIPPGLPQLNFFSSEERPFFFEGIYIVLKEIFTFVFEHLLTLPFPLPLPTQAHVSRLWRSSPPLLLAPTSRHLSHSWSLKCCPPC